MSEEIKEILEIFKKINEEYSVDTELDFEDYEIPNIYLKQFLDYITNLQEENKKLKELCDKYEEEHKTTFIEWQKDIKANKKAIEYINEMCLCSNGYCDYGDDLNPEHIIDILKGNKE